MRHSTPFPPPPSSRIRSIIRLECRRNKWNHPLPSSCEAQTIPPPPTAIHPYIVTRTKSRATDDSCYVLYGNHIPLSTIPLLFRVAAENQGYPAQKMAPNSFPFPLSI